jgi:hypothetical protein
MLKIKRLGLILTVEEKQFVIQLAKIEGGLSQSSLIRRLIHKAASAHGLEILEPRFTDSQVGESHE